MISASRGRPGGTRSILGTVVVRASAVRFDEKVDAQGYWTSVDGRWKAKDRKLRGELRAVTLTDTTRRTTFADTGASWTRLASWDASAT